MKVQKIIIKNVGLIEDTEILIDKPLILFYGDIRQGKTTLLNCVKYALGATWPTDIIRHGADEASVTLEFDNGSVSRSWYFGKNGPSARAIQFIRDGKPVPRPSEEIAKLLNPFLFDQDYLRDMSELERKQYFVKLFNVDTKEFDDYLAQIDEEAKTLRAKIKGYGEIDLTEYETVDVTVLREELASIRSRHDSECRIVEDGNNSVSAHNVLVERGTLSLATIQKEIIDLEAQLAAKIARKAEIAVWLAEHPAQALAPRPEVPDTQDLESRISDAAANEVRVDQYKKNLERSKQKESDEARVLEIEAQKRDIKQQKADKLAYVSSTCGIKGLLFDQDGNFEYNGTSAGMLSTSQIMQLSQELSALYPEGFGLSLIDRAESLGKSVFQFVEKAKREELTILATIVGERPAQSVDEVGMFIIVNGSVAK